ncbi:MAG TPA: TIGR01777 family oxidoreductase [Solirubrobacteraceae bacterium]|jgi:hypothetical protein
MRVTVTGATGLIGSRLVAALRARGNEVTVLSRDPQSARAALGEVEGVRWDLMSELAPAQALRGRDAVVHLAGESIAQRWTASAKRAILESRVSGTRHLVEGLAAVAEDERPGVLVSSSGVGYYGARGEEPIDEETPPGTDFLAQTCVAWESEARAAEALSVRVVRLRTGVVLDPRGGALAKMLPPFKLGVGGPVAGGSQYISWVHTEDLVGIALAAIDGERWQGAVNATAPEPERNREFSKALGRALHRPSLLPVPGAALRLVYGEMAATVTTGARALPARALMNGYEFRYPRLDAALRAVLA